MKNKDKIKEQLIQGTSSHWSRRLAAIPVPAFIVVIAVLFILDARAVFEPPLLLSILNTVFLCAMPLAVAYTAARVYVASGSLGFILLGCGMLVWGSGGLVAGWLIGTLGGPNVNVIIYDTGALFGSVFQILGAIVVSVGTISEEKVLKRGNLVMLAYPGVLVLMALLTIASLQGAIPPYFIQGVGPTLLDQGVLVTTVALFAISALLFRRLYSKSKSDFLYWYFLALVLVAVGLSGVLLQKAVGSPIGWAGRSAQYLGGTYFLIAVLRAIREVRAKRMPLERVIAGFFRESETHYRALVETVTDAVISYDHESRVLLWNSAAWRMFGYSRGEAVGSLLVDLIVPDEHADSFRKGMEDFTKTGKGRLIGRTTEMEAKRKDGKAFPVELSVSARKTAGGWISTSIIRDITERKRAEEELKKTQQDLDIIFDSVPALIWQKSRDGIYQQVNKAYCETVGISKEDILGKTDYDLYPQDIADQYTSYDQELINSGKPEYGIIEHHQRPSGERGWSHTDKMLYYDLDGNIRGTIGFALDITDRKRAEEELRKHREHLEESVIERTTELRESEEKSRAQYKGIPVPTYTWQKVGEDLVLVNYNDAALEVTQGGVANFVGTKATEMYRDRPEIRDEIERCLAEKTTIEREMAYEYMSIGESKHLAVKYAFVPPDLVLVHTEDITPRVRAQEEIEKRTAELRKVVNAMAGREVRMAELKDVIRQLRAQLEDAGLTPEADDPLLAGWEK